jgi:hypothetical protein
MRPRFKHYSFLICAASLAPILGPTLILNGCTNSSAISVTSSSGSATGTGSGSGAPAAYIYIADQTSSSGPNQIVGYAADANGRLTTVPGSPFSQDVGSMAASGTYLMATANTQPDINSYTIGSNGALTLASQFNYTQETGYRTSSGSGCGSASGLRFDHSGQSLYATVGNIDCSSNNAIASFAVSSSNGSLSYLGNVNIGYNSSGDIAFLGDNDFAYSAFPGIYWTVLSLERSGNGNLIFNSSFATVRPIAAPPGSSPGLINGYTPGITATDTANHVAMAEFPDFTKGSGAPPVQLASYTADANGDLSTNDTYATMPATSVSKPIDLEISPSGTLLAVGGVGGLQIFHFNGGSSMTSFTGLLTTDSIAQVAWDNSNHLYAITLSGGIYGSNAVSPGKLYVFTVTSTTVTEAPGSPYTIASPVDLAVQAE